MSATYDVVVVGAGIFGASVAYHLKESGLPRVLLVDKGLTPATGTTSASAAIIRQHYSNKVLSQATGDSITILKHLEKLQRGRALFNGSGWCFLVPEESLEGAVANVAMQREAGINTSLTEAKDFSSRFPWLNTDGVAAVVHEPGSGYADPVACVEALVEQFRALGGTTQFGTRCISLLKTGNRISGVVTPNDRISAGWTVNACGPWSAMLADSAGIPLPVEVYREQETVWQCAHAKDMPPYSISDGVDAIYLRPMGAGRYTIGRGFPKEYTKADPDAYDAAADDDFVSDVLCRAQLRFPPFAHCKYLNGFASLYDVTPDWYPFVGKRSDVDGYADASGGSGHGFKLAPALGQCLARWLMDGEVSTEIRRLSHDRVILNQMFVQKFGGNRG